MHALPRPLRWPSIFPLQNGLVLWLPFDDRSGAKLYDRSGKENHGTIDGATWVAGHRGSALKFNGLTDYAKLGINVFSQATFDKGVTFAALVKVASFNDTIQRIFSVEGRMILGISATSDRAVFQLYDGAFHTAYELTALLPDIWYLLVGTWDTTTLRLYVNAVLGDITTTSNVPTIDAVDRISSIGISYNLVTLPLDGIIQKLWVINRALNVAEIKRMSESELILARH